MSPEQTLNQEITIASDLWNLGVILYYIYHDVYPFEGADNEETFD